MNASSVPTICMLSLMTAASGLSTLQAIDFTAFNLLNTKATAHSEMSLNRGSLIKEHHLSLDTYEPPPDIGGPKRTGGSGGRYV